MSEIAGKLYKYSSTALAVLNTVLMLADCWRLNYVLMNQTGSTAKWLTMPSIVIVLLAVIGLALLISITWLRPLWLRLVLSIVWLVAGTLLLLKLSVLPMSPSADGAMSLHDNCPASGPTIGKTFAVYQSAEPHFAAAK